MFFHSHPVGLRGAAALLLLLSAHDHDPGRSPWRDGHAHDVIDVRLMFRQFAGKFGSLCHQRTSSILASCLIGELHLVGGGIASKQPCDK